MDTISVEYKFEFEDGSKDNFKVDINADTMELITDDTQKHQKWTSLEFKKCPHCPLDKKDFPQCPIASNLNHLVEYFKDTDSFLQTNVLVETANRNYIKKTDLQSAVFSIFGLIMATSKCPHMDFLKPMARFHLPFADPSETMIRAISMYLLKQYFVAKDGGHPDLQLDELETFYSNLHIVNQGIIERIRSLGTGDVQANAIVILDTFATLLSIEISNDLSRIRKYFA